MYSLPHSLDPSFPQTFQLSNLLTLWFLNHQSLHHTVSPSPRLPVLSSIQRYSKSSWLNTSMLTNRPHTGGNMTVQLNFIIQYCSESLKHHLINIYNFKLVLLNSICVAHRFNIKGYWSSSRLDIIQNYFVKLLYLFMTQCLS